MTGGDAVASGLHHPITFGNEIETIVLEATLGLLVWGQPDDVDIEVSGTGTRRANLDIYLPVLGCTTIKSREWWQRNRAQEDVFPDRGSGGNRLSQGMEERGSRDESNSSTELGLRGVRSH